MEIYHSFPRITWYQNNTKNLEVAVDAKLCDSHFLLLRSLLTTMKANGYGRIGNVSSLAASLQYTNTRAYNISKAALNMLTRKLVAELVNTGILVNYVDPGCVATDMGGRGGRPIQQGIVWTATLPDDGPSGGFFCDGEAVPW
jgi:NAD(P)-dependent dehydrogenase (short-subunit alcohol dehydrogenase family)